MSKQVIIIKSYEYKTQTLLWILTAMFGIPAIIALLNDILLGAYIVGGFSLSFLVMSFLVVICSRTYDIYSDGGIQRVRAGKVIIDLNWNQVESLFYDGIVAILIASPCTLTVCLKAGLKRPFPKNLNNSDNERYITTRMSKRTFRKISAMMHAAIEHDTIK